MQNKKIIFIVLALSALFTLSGCEILDGHNASMQPKYPEKDVDRSTSLACYLNACFETTHINQAIEQSSDYVYPSAAEFPNPKMRPQYRPPFALLDLNIISKNTKLSENFSAGEFVSAQKGRFALFSSHVLTQMQFIRNLVKRAVRITSGYRSPGYNRKIDGSARWSRHTYGDAVDFSIPGLSIQELQPLCEEFQASFTLLYERHIHCDWRTQTLDPAFYKPSGRKANEPQEKLNPYEQMESESAIKIVYVKNGAEVSVVSNWFEHEEDEGLPLHRWVITSANSSPFISNETTVLLPKSDDGYNIEVEVGGAITLHTRVQW